jgi:hypothetical protein
MFLFPPPRRLTAWIQLTFQQRRRMSPANVYQTPALELAVDRHGRSAVVAHLDRSGDKVR